MAQLAALIEASIMVNRSNDITLALGESFILGSGHILTDEHLGNISKLKVIVAKQEGKVCVVVPNV